MIKTAYEFSDFADEIFKDIFSMEYINDIIYGHPERLSELQPVLKLLDIDLTPHIVLTIVFDNFWAVCENKNNACRYRLKRKLLNHTRGVLRNRMKGVASSLIGTDKVVLLLDCGERSPEAAEQYARHCAVEIMKAVNKQGEFSVSIGISNYCGVPVHLWRAYEQSFRSLENSFQMGNGQILTYSPPLSKTDRELAKFDQEQIIRDFITALSTKNQEACLNTLNDFTAKLALQNADASYTKSLIVIILSELAGYCIRIGLDSTELSEKIIVIVNDIFKADTMNAIKQETLSFLYYLSGKITNKPLGNGILDVARAYIEQYFKDDISLTQVAGLCGYSPAYFSRCFKECFGINFVQFLMRTRLKNARLLLKDSDLSVAEIWGKTGFQSLSYFSTAFKKEVGMTPNQYRDVQKRL